MANSLGSQHPDLTEIKTWTNDELEKRADMQASYLTYSDHEPPQMILSHMRELALINTEQVRRLNAGK